MLIALGGGALVVFLLTAVATFIDWQSCRRARMSWPEESIWGSRKPKLSTLFAVLGLVLIGSGMFFTSLFMSRVVLGLVGTAVMFYAYTMRLQENSSDE